MQTMLKRTGAVLAALAVSFAITAIGQGLWGVMAIVNVKLTPALPWAAIVMPLVLAALVALPGRPRLAAARAPQARRALVPLAPVSRRAWTWSLVGRRRERRAAGRALDRVGLAGPHAAQPAARHARRAAAGPRCRCCWSASPPRR